MNKMALLVSSAALALMVTGCTSTPEECDPSQDPGFFNKMGCTFSGSYNERIQQKEQQVADLKAENERLNQLARDIFDKDTLLKANVGEKVRLLDKATAEINAVEASLAKKRALSSDLQDQIDDMRAKIDKAKKSSGAQLTIKQKQKQIEELEAQLQELQDSLTQ